MRYRLTVNDTWGSNSYDFLTLEEAFAFKLGVRLYGKGIETFETFQISDEGEEDEKVI